VILPVAENSRSVYQISVAASDTEQPKAVVARSLCPDPDHAPPCPLPWESRSSIAGGTVDFVFYAADGQAQAIFGEVRMHDLGEVRLFKSFGENGQPIDGSTVVDQFRVEQGLPES
jgi:hypothetical protein